IIGYPDFLSEVEEKDLLQEFQKLSWNPLHSNGVIIKQVLIRDTDQLPFCLEPLLPRIAHLMHVKPVQIKEILITHYPKGAGIGWHQDSQEFGDVIGGVSLLSGCTLKFRHEIGSQFEIFRTELPNRSAYVIADE